MNDHIYRVLNAIGEITQGLRIDRNPMLSYGDIFQIDLRQQTLFPLVHVNITQAQITGANLNLVEITIDVITLDLVDKNTNDIREVDANGSVNQSWYRSMYSNETDVLNDTLWLQNAIIAGFQRGLASNSPLYIQLADDSVSLQPFFDDFENNLAGWQATYTLRIPNTSIDACANEY